MKEDEEKGSPLKDLNPENKRKRKEPPKPWGKRERYIVLAIFLITVLTAASLAVSARDFKLPGLPKFEFNFVNPFREETIVIGKKESKYSKITKIFEEKTKKLSGTYSLYVIDLSNDYSFGIGETNIMQAASIIKLPVMLYADGKVPDSKIEAMGKRSDNAVFTEIVKKFGKEEIQKYIGELGMANTSLEKNTTTPKEMGDLIKKIYTDKNEKILAYLTDTIFESWLVKGVPEGVRVAHKYGREVHVVNDAGIVYADSPYIAVIMTQGIIEKEADEVFPELSRLVYDGMNQ